VETELHDIVEAYTSGAHGRFCPLLVNKLINNFGVNSAIASVNESSHNNSFAMTRPKPL